MDFRIGTIDEYKSITPHPDDLYFCTDLHEMYAGSTKVAINNVVHVTALPDASEADPSNVYILDTDNTSLIYIVHTATDGTKSFILGSAKPDWNENDSSAAGYIENRTHWKEESTTNELIVSWDKKATDVYTNLVNQADRLYKIADLPDGMNSKSVESNYKEFLINGVKVTNIIGSSSNINWLYLCSTVVQEPSGAVLAKNYLFFVFYNNTTLRKSDYVATGIELSPSIRVNVTFPEAGIYSVTSYNDAGAELVAPMQHTTYHQIDREYLPAPVELQFTSGWGSCVVHSLPDEIKSLELEESQQVLLSCDDVYDKITAAVTRHQDNFSIVAPGRNYKMYLRSGISAVPGTWKVTDTSVKFSFNGDDYVSVDAPSSDISDIYIASFATDISVKLSGSSGTYIVTKRQRYGYSAMVAGFSGGRLIIATGAVDAYGLSVPSAGMYVTAGSSATSISMKWYNLPAPYKYEGIVLSAAESADLTLSYDNKYTLHGIALTLSRADNKYTLHGTTYGLPYGSDSQATVTYVSDNNVIYTGIINPMASPYLGTLHSNADTSLSLSLYDTSQTAPTIDSNSREFARNVQVFAGEVPNLIELDHNGCLPGVTLVRAFLDVIPIKGSAQVHDTRSDTESYGVIHDSYLYYSDSMGDVVAYIMPLDSLPDPVMTWDGTSAIDNTYIMIDTHKMWLVSTDLDTIDLIRAYSVLNVTLKNSETLNIDSDMLELLPYGVSLVIDGNTLMYATTSGGEQTIVRGQDKIKVPVPGIYMANIDGIFISSLSTRTDLDGSITAVALQGAQFAECQIVEEDSFQILQLGSSSYLHGSMQAICCYADSKGNTYTGTVSPLAYLVEPVICLGILVNADGDQLAVYSDEPSTGYTRSVTLKSLGNTSDPFTIDATSNTETIIIADYVMTLQRAGTWSDIAEFTIKGHNWKILSSDTYLRVNYYPMDLVKVLVTYGVAGQEYISMQLYTPTTLTGISSVGNTAYGYYAPTVLSLSGSLNNWSYQDKPTRISGHPSHIVQLEQLPSSMGGGIVASNTNEDTFSNLYRWATNYGSSTVMSISAVLNGAIYYLQSASSNQLIFMHIGASTVDVLQLTPSSTTWTLVSVTPFMTNQGTSNAGKALVVGADGNVMPAGFIVPQCTVSDAGKILTVGEDGKPTWVTPT